MDIDGGGSLARIRCGLNSRPASLQALGWVFPHMPHDKPCEMTACLDGKIRPLMLLLQPPGGTRSEGSEEKAAALSKAASRGNF